MTNETMMLQRYTRFYCGNTECDNTDSYSSSKGVAPKTCPWCLDDLTPAPWCSCEKVSINLKHEALMHPYITYCRKCGAKWTPEFLGQRMSKELAYMMEFIAKVKATDDA